MHRDAHQPLLPFEQQLAENWPAAAWSDRTVAVAVSGGADSVALLCGLARIRTAGRGRLIALHFDHRLRGAESAADAEFVVALANKLGLTAEIGRADPRPGSTTHDGLEAAAREARYAYLLAAAERAGARFLATGHTADDQAETILHHVIRGTGLEGLAGMDRCRNLSAAVTLIRPLLTVRKRQAIDYLESLGQCWRDDATNASVELTRNRIRHDLLPRLAADYNPAVVDALLRLGHQAAAAEQIVRDQAASLLRHASFLPDGRVRLSASALDREPRHLIRELLVLIWRERQWPLQNMGYEQWERLAGLIQNAAATPTAGKRRRGTTESIVMTPGQIRAVRQGHEVILEPPA